MWVLVLASLGVLGTAAGMSLVVLGAHHRRAAERTLWAAGSLFALGAIPVLLDGSPGHFPYSSRAAGCWLALAGCLIACFGTTFGSARLPAPEAAESDTAGVVDAWSDEAVVKPPGGHCYARAP